MISTKYQINQKSQFIKFQTFRKFEYSLFVICILLFGVFLQVLIKFIVPLI